MCSLFDKTWKERARERSLSPIHCSMLTMCCDMRTASGWAGCADGLICSKSQIKRIAADSGWAGSLWGILVYLLSAIASFTTRTTSLTPDFINCVYHSNPPAWICQTLYGLVRITAGSTGCLSVPLLCLSWFIFIFFWVFVVILFCWQNNQFWNVFELEHWWAKAINAPVESLLV